MIKKNAEKGEDFPAQRMKEREAQDSMKRLWKVCLAAWLLILGSVMGGVLLEPLQVRRLSKENTGPVPIYQTKRISAFGRTDPSGRYRKGHSEREDRDRGPLDFLEAVHCDGG